MLRLDIAWLMGTAWLARDPSSAAPDWPPQPDRVFSALAASWGAGGEDAAERAALEWLEERAPPELLFYKCQRERPAPTVFVPPNDSGVTDIAILPTRRRRQPRRFPAVALDTDSPAHLSLIWADDAPPAHLAALNDLAFRTSYVGHSSSIVRCLFRTEHAVEPADGERTAASRAPYPGRLEELIALHARHLAGDERARPRPSTHTGAPALVTPAPESVFAGARYWTVFEHADGERPDLRAAAIVCDALRMALMRAWTATNDGQAPSWISGHEPDRSPACDTHLAIVPLANVGFAHSEGRLMGLAIIPPRTVAARWSAPGPEGFHARQAFSRVIAALGDEINRDGARIITLGGGGAPRWSWRIKSAESQKASLNPARYARASRRWASVTPVLLDRHLKTSGDEARKEARALVEQACARLGLPTPVSVELMKHSAISGAPPAWPAGGNPDWMDWSRKKSFGKRNLFHLLLTFPEPVRGPVLIGAGRFVGLGLCLPVADVAERGDAA